MGPLHEFAIQLLDARTGNKGQSLPVEVRAEMEAELIDRIEQFLNQRLIDAMSEPALARFNELLEKNPRPAEVQTFVAGAVLDNQAVAAAALAEFSDIYLGRQ